MATHLFLFCPCAENARGGGGGRGLGRGGEGQRWGASQNLAWGEGWGRRPDSGLTLLGRKPRRTSRTSIALSAIDYRSNPRFSADAEGLLSPWQLLVEAAAEQDAPKPEIKPPKRDEYLRTHFVFCCFASEFWLFLGWFWSFLPWLKARSMHSPMKKSRNKGKTRLVVCLASERPAPRQE